MNCLKLTLSGLVTLALSAPAEAQHPFSLSGKIEGLPDSLRVVLYNVEDPNGDISEIAAADPENGAFELKGDFAEPTMCRLNFMRYKKADEQYRSVMSVDLMLDPAPIALSSDCDFNTLVEQRNAIDHLNLTGSVNAGRYVEYCRHIGEAKRNNDSIGYLSARKFFDTSADPDTVRKYDAMKAVAEKGLLDRKMEFVRSHPEYNISAYLMQRELENIFKYDADEIDALADLVQTCPDTARVNTVNKRRDFCKRYALGITCPKFDATTPEGEVVNFNSLLTPGKYTFIDFWASWCGPCRAAIPHVKELHKKYADRMDVFSVSLDENDKAWRKALEKEQMEWQQFILADDNQKKEGMTGFFIQSIPRLVLLDDKGRVVCSTHDPNVMTAAIEERIGK